MIVTLLVLWDFVVEVSEGTFETRIEVSGSIESFSLSVFPVCYGESRFLKKEIKILPVE